MHCYTAFNLCIQSEILMPEFIPCSGKPVVFFEYGNLSPPDGSDDEETRIFMPAQNGALLHWSLIGTFLVEQGRKVTIAPCDGVDERLLRLVLTGPVLGILLFQRGWMVYHASVVACPHTGSAVAFVAQKGGGKSTMATALCNAGYSMVSDDIMPVSMDGEVPLVPPGFPHAKLWSDTAVALVQDGGKLPLLAPDFDKRSHFVSERFLREPALLKAVFVLEAAPTIQIEPLSGYGAIQALLPHWYGALFDGQLLPLLGRERYFNDTASLASRVPIFRLERPHSFDLLPDVVDQVSGLLADFLEE